MAGILVVCTGNVCRSPIAEGMLRAALTERLGRDAPQVRSAGTMGWVGSAADPNSVQAAVELGVDLSEHRASALAADDVREADLLLGMGAEHARAAIELDPDARTKTFTLTELVRLLERLPPAGAGDPARVVRDRVAAASALRAREGSGDRYDDDVVDPLGMPLETFRWVARELDGLCRRLVAGLVGPAERRAATGAGGRER